MQLASIFGAFLIFQVSWIYCKEGFRDSQSDDCGRVDEVPGDLRTKVPWVAGIFARTSSSRPFDFLITGTIIDPFTVLTVFGGAYGQPPAEGRKYSIPSAQNHKVGVALKSTDLNDADRYTQILEVSYILPYPGNDPENKQYHFFLFKLKTPLNLKTPYARAACIPVFAKHLPPDRQYGQDLDIFQGGFAGPGNNLGAKKKELKVAEVKLESSEFCSRNFYSIYRTSADHVYCGKLSPQSPTCVSYGTAAVVPIYNNRWFVIGVNSLHPMPPGENSWCSRNTVFYFGRVAPAIDWIMGHLKCAGQEYSCGDKCIGQENICNRRADCADRRDEDPVFCRARRPCVVPGKTFECGVYGPCLKQALVCDGKRDCPDGEDEAPEKCGRVENTPAPFNLGELTSNKQTYEPELGNRGSNTASLKCPPLQRSEGVVIDCTDQYNEKIECEQATPGSSAKFQCKQHYQSTYRLPSTAMTCKEDGSWKPFRSFGCEPQCGILQNKDVQAYIVDGQTATKREPFPWHAAIFARRRNSDYSFICGGSLIEKNVIMTAAHCVTDGSGAQFPTNTLKIVLGANSSNLEINEQSSDTTQIFTVKNIWVPATYDRRTLQSDIGLIQLDRQAVYGEFVRPVCYLIKGSNSVPPSGTLGKVPGFGYTAELKISDYLQFGTFPVISTSECVNSLRKTPPLSTYCAGYRNGTSVCQGDSGGGMVFPENSAGTERYVLRGLVSHGDVKAGKLCDPFNYAVFTHVDAYADWILQKLESILKK